MVTWREQIVAYCVLFIARMFADDHQLKQDLKNLSNKITTAATPVPAVPTARAGAVTLDDLAGP